MVDGTGWEYTISWWGGIGESIEKSVGNMAGKSAGNVVGKTAVDMVGTTLLGNWSRK